MKRHIPSVFPASADKPARPSEGSYIALTLLSICFFCLFSSVAELFRYLGLQVPYFVIGLQGICIGIVAGALGASIILNRNNQSDS